MILYPKKYKHWTPRYIKNRVLTFIYAYRHPNVPWLTRDAVSFLESWLKPNDVGFEWGSGRSTLWLAHRVQKLVSVEHDFIWYNRVKGELSVQGLDHVDLHYIPLEDGPRCSYAEFIETVSSATLDFIIIDGRSRAYCTSLSFDKLRPGGLLILDNAERYIPHPSHSPERIEAFQITPEWESLLQRLQPWRWIWTSDGVTDTALFIKPCI